MSATGARIKFYNAPEYYYPTGYRPKDVPWLYAYIECGCCGGTNYPPDLESRCQRCDSMLFTQDEALAVLAAFELGATLDQLEKM